MSDRYFDKQQPFDVTARRLPHWYQDGKIYFVTFRLGDSLPQTVLENLKVEREQWIRANGEPDTQEKKNAYQRLFNGRVNQYLDAGYGACVLSDSRAAQIMESAILYFHGERCLVHTYVVMSNHVHLIAQPFEGIELKRILHSIKSFTANRINQVLNQSGRLWSRETYDRLIRDAGHYESVRRYIQKNIDQGGVRWNLNVI